MVAGTRDDARGSERTEVPDAAGVAVSMTGGCVKHSQLTTHYNGQHIINHKKVSKLYIFIITPKQQTVASVS